MSRSNVLQTVRGLKPGRSVFNLSYTKLFDCYHGQLIPVLADEMVPGDKFKIGNELVIRLHPLVSPALHELNVFVHYFFVPYRLLWDQWEDFITGGPDGTNADVPPTWIPVDNTKWSLWDHLGMPVGVDPVGAYPVDFPKRAYNFIYNEYYRDQNLITEIDITTEEKIQRRAWEKDYFTASLPWQQRGTAPALPVTGTTVAEWQAGDFAQGGGPANVEFSVVGGPNDPKLYVTNDATGDGQLNANAMFNSNVVDLSNATTFNVSDLRLAFQIQKWMERNARAGVRYTEFLRSHFGVAPRDDRLDRPEYISGSRSPIIISEVLQTSETATTPQGTLAGHGITSDRNRLGSYYAQEYGVIMGILSVMPKTQYSQGINKQWLRYDRYAYYFPEFAHLSEQPVIRAELYADGVSANNNTIFGYVPRFDEMRIKYNQAAGDMGYGGALNYWNLAREFATAPGLNAEFIECDGTTASQTRIFAHGSTAPGYIVYFANKITAVRPIPAEGDPGLIDHF